MTIRFKCPQCQKPLSVKEHLAGKKAACPVCKKAITIPAAVAAPAPVDVESFAAEAFADNVAKPAATVSAKTIDFNCPFCDEELKLSADLAGKKTPCPQCTKVITVPKLKEEKPKDWRTTQKGGPSAALANLPEQLDDAWGTEQKGRVSREAMAEAGALPEAEKEPVSIGRWVRRGVWTCVAAGVLFFIVSFAVQRFRSGREQSHVDEALKYLADMTPLHQVEAHRAIGEIHVRNKRAEKALESFQLARSVAPKGGEDPASTFERDLLLIKLALAQADMGGTGDDTLRRSEGAFRFDWSDGIVQREVLQTLEAMQTTGAKAAALRALACKLTAGGQPDVAMSLVANVASGGNGAGGGASQRSPFLAQQKGLQFARGIVDQPREKDGDKEKEKGGDDDPYYVAAPEPGKPIADPVARVAYTECHAYKKEFAEALKLVRAPGVAQGRLEACVAAAGIALADASPKEAQPFVDEGLAACGELSADMKEKAAAWAILELVRLGSRTDADPAKLKSLAEQLPAALRPLSQLAMFEGYLDRNPAKAGDGSRIDEVGTDKQAVRAFAWEALARHNARLGQSGTIAIEDADKAVRPFLHLGIALGEQDRAQKK